ncbi:MAG TPA: hypothetical protein VGQ90_04870 [Stellaceae bacterium]|jgi:hypothetical protein|nr:hypothetical protein [Stellaceae bacterium]
MQADSAEAIGGGTPSRDAAGAADRRFGTCRRLLGLGAATALFFTAVVPIGLVMRVFGRDKLRLRRDAGAASYWIGRDPPGPAPGSMTRQR